MLFLLALLLPLQGTDPAAELEPALAEMEAAALAGDPARWMATIDANNSFFTQE